jgi:hypothetical protein
VLAHLRFGRSSGVATVEIDKHVAGYLVGFAAPPKRESRGQAATAYKSLELFDFLDAIIDGYAGAGGPGTP